MRILFLTTEGAFTNLIDWLNNEANDDVLVQTEKITLDYLDDLEPEFIISYNYRYIISEEVLNKYPDIAINMHISLLPWNRGADPNFWSIVENSPKGVTIHRLDRGVDTGEILAQKEVVLDMELDTLASSYDKLHKEMQVLFKEKWSLIKTNSLQSTPQSHEGSSHWHKEFLEIEKVLGAEGWDVPIPILISRYQSL